MAFSFTKESEFNQGGAKVVTGTWTSAGAGIVGGEVTTGLQTINYAKVSIYSASLPGSEAVFDETFPFSAGPISIVTTTGTTGGWIAIGY